MKPQPTLALLLLLAITPASPGSPPGPERLPLLVGPTPDQVRLQWVDTAQPSAPATTGAGPFRVLKVGMAGDYLQDSLLTDRPRVQPVGVDESVLVLPTSDRQRLIHYSTSSGMFGFLLINGAGESVTLLERPGLGIGGTLDPFDPTVGVSRSGEEIAISIPYDEDDPSDEGEVWLISTDSKPLSDVSIERVYDAAGAEVSGDSLVFAGDYLFAVDRTVLLRKSIDDNASMVPLTIPPGAAGPPVFVDPCLATSDEGTRIAFLAGPAELLVDVYSVEVASGVVKRLSAAPADVQPPILYKIDPGAPHLAFSDDGTQLAWKTLIDDEFELFLAQPGIAGTPAVHVTKAPDFWQYIDTVGGILGSGTRMLFVAGSTYEGDADLYTVDLVEGDDEDEGPIVNITATSGQSSPPFTSGNPSKMVVAARHRLDEVLLVSDDQSAVGSGWRLWRVSELEEAALVADQLAAQPELVASTWAGSHSLLTLRRAATTAFHRLLQDDDDDSSSLPPPDLLLPSWIEITRTAIMSSGNTLGLAAELLPGATFVGVVPLHGGSPRVMPGPPFAAVTRLDFSAGGLLRVSAATTGGDQGAVLFDAVTGDAWSIATDVVAEWIP